MAGIVGATAFYFSVFLYENERGNLQNRLENLWVAIDDRAKAIDSTSTALFNKIGDIVVRWTNWLFGDRFFSLRAFCTSTNLSLSGVIFGFFAPLFIVMFIQNRSDYGNQPVVYFTQVMIVIVFVTLVLLFLAILPAISKRRAALFFASLPLIYSVVVSVVRSLFTHKFPPLYKGLPSYAVPAMLEYILIVITRRLFARISDAPKLPTLLGAMSIFVLFSFSVSVLPLVIMKTIYHVPLAALKSAETVFDQLPKLTHTQLFVFAFALSNLTTSVMGLLPFALLAIIMLHKLIWPTLRRLLLPVADNKLLYNKKALNGIGALAFTYALNLEQVGVKAFLKLFAS